MNSESAYMVRFYIGETLCKKVFVDKWQAEAFVKYDCDQRHKAIIIKLIEE